jgi:hypothetical protein
MEGCIKRKDEVISAKLSKSIFLINGRVESDSSHAGHSVTCGVLVDSFESIQAARVLLSHKVNGRIISLTQGAQELVIIEARVAIGRFGTNGAISSLKNRKLSEAILNLTSIRVRDSPPNEQVTELVIETLR